MIRRQFRLVHLRSKSVNGRTSAAVGPGVFPCAALVYNAPAVVPRLARLRRVCDSFRVRPKWWIRDASPSAEVHVLLWRFARRCGATRLCNVLILAVRSSVL